MGIARHNRNLHRRRLRRLKNTHRRIVLQHWKQHLLGRGTRKMCALGILGPMDGLRTMRYWPHYTLAMPPISGYPNSPSPKEITKQEQRRARKVIHLRQWAARTARNKP